VDLPPRALSASPCSQTTDRQRLRSPGAFLFWAIDPAPLTLTPE